MIDSHIHADTRPFEDFEAMAVSGIREAVTCAHDPLEMLSSDVVMAHFRRILKVDPHRAALNGLKLHTALGVHPRAIPHDYMKVLEELPELLSDPSVVAVGEIGLDSGSETEMNVFIEQLRIADETDRRVIVHTPRSGKEEITPLIADLLSQHIDERRAVIEHVNMDVIPLLIESDFMLGLTVQPEKLTPQEAVQILKEYGTDRFVLNSDMSSSPSDPLSVPRTVHRMRISGFGEGDIMRVSEKNIRKFLKIKN
ncbi:TatD family hydrolase [Methanothermobacter wolfeii]|uniref:TatD family hydrolase n=1 Tax=Methanothermobacter wolfeii TaxID=145261 RepID=A0A9E7RX82_METWO|nr:MULTISPECIES: TatD family hydrolase [Methanothermobacter]NLM01793.1 hypothetical protein [Methanothermobacter wolfeii]QHN05920.1 hypothetical protein FZP57_01745 [Methanothermobacter sp. THM-1]UXH32084.1 TatD family hydrolase [Methanothermobacter wolfeii]SCM56186.1 putative protein MJ1383 [Methanothermobacter wolfeii]